MFRQLALAAVLALTAVAATDCAWWAKFEADPIAQVQVFEQGAQTILNDAQVAWTVIQPLIPASVLSSVTQQYEKAVYSANLAIQALNDAILAAQLAQQTDPNLTQVVAAVVQAVETVVAIIDQYAPSTTPDGGTIPAKIALTVTPPDPFLPSLTAAHAGMISLKKIHIK